MASGPIYQLPIFINNILWEHSHAHSFTYCLWLLLYHNSGVGWLQPLPIWSAKPKYLLCDPLRKVLSTSDLLLPHGRKMLLLV